jgi:hypothetical protein
MCPAAAVPSYQPNQLLVLWYTDCSVTQLAADNDPD